MDDSETIPPSPRAALIVALADAVREGAQGGDTERVTVATEALTMLIKGGHPPTAQIVDLRQERGRK